MADLIGAEARDILTTIYDALTVPAPALEHGDAADRLLIRRAATVRGVIEAILGDPGLSSLETHARTARRVIAERAPVTYPVREQLAASSGETR